MIVLSAIGKFFAKIGRWIKETAWVQPLLIVGGIFAIIFSIPYLTKWVSSWFSGSNAATSFYRQYEKSLSGAKDHNSEADKLFQYMTSYTEDPSKVSQGDINKYGEKFFIVFVQESCTECESIYGGFDVLGKEWNTNEFKFADGQQYNDYKIHTIFIDTEDTIDDVKKNCFTEFFANIYDADFEELSSVMEESYYAQNKGTAYTDQLNTVADISNFATPTVMVFDPAYFGVDGNPAVENRLGVAELLFDVEGKDSGTGNYAIARTLFDCWNHTDIFGDSYTSK